MFVDVQVMLGTGEPVIALPASAINYAPYGNSVFIVDEMKGPKGAKLPRRAPAVREARATGAATRSRCSPGSSPARRSSPRASSSSATAPPSSSTTRCSRRNDPSAEAGGQLMKFTDLFIRRPVLAIVVNLVILIAGLQSIRSLSVRQFPRSDIAVVRVHDRLRRRQRRPGARLHHDAARARDRERRRHRLHRVVERPGREHDHRAPEAQLRHQRRADPDPGQGGAGAQRPAARGGGADHRGGDRGHPVRGDVPRLLVRRISIRTRSPTT